MSGPPDHTAQCARWLWVALLASVSQAGFWTSPTAEAQEPARSGTVERATLGTHGDWTSYVLRDGALRLCFVETKPVVPADVALPTDIPALQLTHRTARSQEHLVRLAPDSERAYAIFLGPGLLGHLGGGWSTKRSQFVDRLLADEAAGTVLSIRDDEAEDTVLGTYSLQGLGDAHAAIRKACPGRETPTDVLASGEVVRVQPYVELALSGPFAEPGRSERFSVRFFPNERVEEHDFPKELPASAALVPHLRNVDRLEFLRGETSLGEVGGAYHLDFQGTCLDAGSERIKTVFESWGGGASTPASTSTVELDPEKGLVEKFLSDTERGYLDLDCSPGERLWGEGGEDFRPCSCDHAYPARLGELAREIEKATSLSAPETSVAEEELADLLAHVERISPFLDWDSYASLEVDKMASSEYSLVVVTYSSEVLHWSSFQYLFGRRNSDDVWKFLYEAPLSSKAFHAVDIQGFVGAGTLELDMCVEIDCGGWGRHETVRIDVGKWLESIGREGDDFLAPVFARAIAEANAAREAADAAERQERE